MGDEEDGAERKRYKRFLDANYKPENVHPFTHRKWRNEADNQLPLKEEENEAPPVLIAGQHLSSQVLYMSDSENESVSSEDERNQEDYEIEDIAETIRQENNMGNNMDTEDLSKKEMPRDGSTSRKEEGFAREVFNEISSCIMFPEANLTIREVSLMIIALCIRFNLSYVVRQMLFDLVKCLAGPKFKDWNVSKLKISQMYDPPDESINLSFFCVKCCGPLLQPISKDKFKDCEVKCKCGETYFLTTGSENYIVNIDLKYQITNLLKNKEVKSALLKNVRGIKDRCYEKDTEISDIYDGLLYKELMTKYASESHVLTYIFNTDGAPIFHSSKQSLWPIQIIINELPPNMRFKHTLLAGICILKKEPSATMMNMYMEQFLQQTESLRTEGFQIISESGEIIKIKLLPLCSSVDTVARPIIQNRMQYNSRQGCSWCYQFGTYVETMRYPVKKENSEMRTHYSHLRDVSSVTKGREEGKSLKEVNGVKGASVLMTLLFFNMAWGFPVDYMHGVLLGVVKQLWEVWIATKIIKPKDVQRINELMTKITRPREIHRAPRPFSEKAKWKATEWKSWLLYYALPCLKEILPDKQFQHLHLLVKAIFKLLKTSISENDLRECEVDLITFVVRSEELYGITFMTFNVHSLLHLVQSVRMTGPLWATSAFPFESAIYQLKKQVTGPKGLYNQIAKRMLRKIAFRCSYEALFKSSPTCLKFCDSLFLSTHRSICATVQEDLQNTVLIGKGRLNNEGDQIFDRCFYKNTLYHSTLYTRPHKTNDTVVQIGSECFAEIKNFIYKDNSVFARVQMFQFDEKNNSLNTEHIFPVSRAQIIQVIPLKEFQEKVLYMNLGFCEYVCKLPNTLEIQ